MHKDLDQLSILIDNADKDRIEAIIGVHGIEACDSDKRTALIWASFFGQVEIVSWLLSKGADVNHQDRLGYSCLHYCAQERRMEIAKTLLENGANPNILDEHANSPLATALFNSRGEFELVRLLMLRGADPDQKNKYGRSANDLSMTIYAKRIDELIRE